jgi:hypothetical protein
MTCKEYIWRLQDKSKTSKKARKHNSQTIALAQIQYGRRSALLAVVIIIGASTGRSSRATETSGGRGLGDGCGARRHRGRGHGGGEGGVGRGGMLGSAGVVSAAGAGAEVVVAAVVHAVGAPLRADVVGERLRVHRDVGGDVVVADAGVGEGVLEEDVNNRSDTR